MKKILLMASIRSEKKEKLLSYMQKYFGDKVEVCLGVFSDLTFEIESGKIIVKLDERNINDFDLVYFRNTTGFVPMVSALSIYLESTKIKFFDKLFISGSFTGDKFTSLTRLAINNVPIVPSFLCWKEALPKNIEKIVKKFDFPIVAKEVTTQRMQSIYLMKSREDFNKWPDITKRGKPARYLFQKFINLDREYRLLVLGDRVKVIHTKTKRDNTAFKVGYQDANEYPEFLSLDDVSETIKNTAVKAAKVLHIQIAGVDICREENTGKIYVFEVNRGPGFDYDTAVSPELSEVSNFLKEELTHD